MSWWDRARDRFDDVRDDARWRNFQGGQEEIGWAWTDNEAGQWRLYDTKLNGLELVTPNDDDYYPDGTVYLYDNDPGSVDEEWP